MTAAEHRPDFSAALRESEEGYRFLAETVPVQIWTALPDGHLDYVTEQTASRLGRTAQQLLAEGWQNVVHPEDLESAIERWTHALATGQTYEVEFRLKLASGEYAWHLARAVPQRNAAGGVVRWFGTNTNIDEQRDQQRQTQLLLEQVAQQNRLLVLESEIGAVLTRSGSLRDGLTACAEAVVRHLDAAFARVWTVNEAGTFLELQASAGMYRHLDGPHGRVPVGQLKIGKIAAERKPHLTNQVVGNPLVAEQAWAVREGMVAFAGYPLVLGDTLLGVIAAFARRSFSASTLLALRSVAHSVAQAIERHRGEEKIRLSANWLATTLSSIGDGVVATDSEGQVTFLNPVASALTGWTEAEAAGQTLSRVLPLFNEETRVAVESPVAKVLREGTVIGLANHTVLRRRDGTEVPIEDSAAPIRGRDGALSGVVLVFRDAGEKRRIEAERVHLLAQELRAHREAEAARAELHALFMQAPAPICVLRGPSHSFSLANPAYMQLIGAGRRVLGLPIREALPELAGQSFFEPLDRVHTTGQRFVGSEVTLHFDRYGRGVGDEAVVTFVYEPFRDLEGEVAGILVMAFDVTDTVRARETVQAALDERERLLGIAESARQNAELASRAKDEFLATASHELRTPLNAILGWAKMLRAGIVDGGGFTRGLEIIERNAKVQVQLIEDILDGSRIITGKLRLELRPVDLMAVVQAAIEAVRPAADAKGIALDVSLDPAAARVKGDPDRLQQILWNLVNNAIKFTPKRGVVAVRLARTGTSVELSVKDNGEGISSDFLPYVFERFRQADASPTRRHGGLGLGLALVRHLAEAHGGAVRAESDGVGQGAKFVVTLPVQAVFPETTPSDRPPAVGQGAQPAIGPDSLRALRVLVIDDEADARELVATVLRSHGAEVLIATSVEQAVELIERCSPTILVSDIGMPGTDGYTLLRRLRELDGNGAKIRAIALTAYAREEDRRRALDAGFQRYLAKPVEPEALVRMVGSLAQSARD